MAAIGKMTKWIAIQRKATTVDEAGQPQDAWSDLCQVWAAVEPLSTREAFIARQAQIVATHKVTIWHRSDVHADAPLLRVVYLYKGSERVLNVLSGTERNDEKAQQLELLCGEVQPWANQTSGSE